MQIVFEQMPIVGMVLALLFGAVVGSFLNVVIYRIPRGYSIGLPSRSMCVDCFTVIPWYRNVPVVGYLIARGRCNNCGGKIDSRHLIIECLSAVLFLAVVMKFGIHLVTLRQWCLLSLLLSITFIDLDFRIIPDKLTYPGIAFALLSAICVGGSAGFLSAVCGLGLGFGLFWFLAFSYERVTGREGLGYGDVKMLGLIGAFLGSKGVVGTIFISSTLGAVIGIALILFQKRSIRMTIPYGPFLALGSLCMIFWSDQFISYFYPGLS